jgi:excinuclease ABC subunit B
VAILDADKEGFLRSARSLIQTIGRASRNDQGRVIMYAYQITESMQYAINETNRRRNIQESYNKEHNITPQSIKKDIFLGPLSILKSNIEANGEFTIITTPEKIDQTIESLQQQMKRYSKQLQFEKAAQIRDEIKKLQELKML